LTNDGPDCVRVLVHNLCYFDYKDDSCPLSLHLRLVILADKYNIHNLDRRASVKFAMAPRNIKSRDELHEAIRVAYELDGPTEYQRKLLVNTVMDAKFPTQALDAILRCHPIFACDVALAFKNTQQLRLGEEDLGK